MAERARGDRPFCEDRSRRPEAFPATASAPPPAPGSGNRPGEAAWDGGLAPGLRLRYFGENKAPAALASGGREREKRRCYSTASMGAISPARIATPLAVTPGNTR